MDVRRLRSGLAWLAGLALAPAAGAAWADDWIVTVGGGAQAAVPYEGAGRDIFLPVPIIQLRRPDRPERPTFDDDPGISIFNTARLNVGPTAALRGERDDHGDRAGLDDVPLAIEPGAFFTFWPTEWLRLHASERRGITGDHGWTGDAALDVVAKSGRWTATLGPRTGWGDQNYMETYFGVTPAEAAASPIIKTAYTPAAGIRYVGGYGSLGYRISPKWQVWANASYHRLSSEAADSPIVRQIGSANDISGGVSVRYTFDWRR